LDVGQRVPVPVDHAERAVYVARGAIESGGRRFEAGQMGVLSPGASVQVEALAPSTVMMLGGEPIGPRFIDWNFVSSSRERIEEGQGRLAGGPDEAPRSIMMISFPCRRTSALRRGLYPDSTSRCGNVARQEDCRDQCPGGGNQ
jgi:hypothetical protein